VLYGVTKETKMTSTNSAKIVKCFGKFTRNYYPKHY
jgi:hypothetical protein